MRAILPKNSYSTSAKRLLALVLLSLGLAVSWHATGAELHAFESCSSASTVSLCVPDGLEHDEVIHVATFDSGFGGYFTAKSIEQAGRAMEQQYAVHFSIDHYGDSLNAPYGEKTPQQIARFAAQGILRAFKGGAQQVFIACNTASTQYDHIKQILDSTQPGLSSRTISIVESSVAELKRQIEGRLN